MAADKNEIPDNALPAEVAADLQQLEQAIREGQDVVARNLISYLHFEVLPTLEPQEREQLSQAITAMNRELTLPVRRRFAKTSSKPRSRSAPTFRCVFCHQRWGWDAAITVPNERGFACTSCAKTVMCRTCGRRKHDDYPTCLRCSGVNSVTSKPHGFHA